MIWIFLSIFTDKLTHLWTVLTALVLSFRRTGWKRSSQFLIRSVWRKILTWCNKLSFIQKYQLKRTSKDETRKRNHKNVFTQPLSFDIEINIIENLSVSKIGIMNHNVIQDIVYIKHANANVKYFGMAIPFQLEMWNCLFFFLND